MEYIINEKGHICVECIECHKYIELPITEAQLNEWKPSEEFIQDKFPQLTPGQREMLLSGICDECWNKIFKEEDDS